MIKSTTLFLIFSCIGLFEFILNIYTVKKLINAANLVKIGFEHLWFQTLDLVFSLIAIRFCSHMSLTRVYIGSSYESIYIFYFMQLSKILTTVLMYHLKYTGIKCSCKVINNLSRVIIEIIPILLQTGIVTFFYRSIVSPILMKYNRAVGTHSEMLKAYNIRVLLKRFRLLFFWRVSSHLYFYILGLGINNFYKSKYCILTIAIIIEGGLSIVEKQEIFLIKTIGVGILTVSCIACLHECIAGLDNGIT